MKKLTWPAFISLLAVSLTCATVACTSSESDGDDSNDDSVQEGVDARPGPGEGEMPSFSCASCSLVLEAVEGGGPGDPGGGMPPERDGGPGPAPDFDGGVPGGMQGEFCDGSTAVLQDLVDCACAGGGAGACADTCATACDGPLDTGALNAGFMACVTCAAQDGNGCTTERNSCAADVPPAE